jgi:hypothetical protein
MELSFTMQTTTNYELPAEKLTELDMATLNPLDEKQAINMQLYDDGRVDMTIRELEFKDKIVIPHQIEADDSPKIVKTVIANKVASFYDKDGKLVDAVKMEIPNQLGLANTIKEMGSKYSAADINNFISTMQGYAFADDLEAYLKDAAKSGTEVLDLGNGYVTVRESLNKIDVRNMESVVLLFDKNINKLAGYRLYDQANNLLQSTLYGYNKGEIESLCAIQTIQKIHLPSGKAAKMFTQNAIEDLKISINL